MNDVSKLNVKSELITLRTTYKLTSISKWSKVQIIILSKGGPFPGSVVLCSQHNSLHILKYGIPRSVLRQ